MIKASKHLKIILILMTFCYLPQGLQAHTVTEIKKLLTGIWENKESMLFFGDAVTEYYFHEDGTGMIRNIWKVDGVTASLEDKEFTWTVLSPSKISLKDEHGANKQYELKIENDNAIFISNKQYTRYIPPETKEENKQEFILNEITHPAHFPQDITKSSPEEFKSYLDKERIKYNTLSSASGISFLLDKVQYIALHAPLYLKSVGFHKNFVTVTYSTTINEITERDTRENKDQYYDDIVISLREAGFQGEKISGDGNEYSKFRINKKDYIVVSVNESPYTCSVDLDFFLH